MFGWSQGDHRRRILWHNQLLHRPRRHLHQELSEVCQVHLMGNARRKFLATFFPLGMQAVWREQMRRTSMTIE
ncbi:hypothetical protein M427DRAFT_432552 [Gonapodya prolifera JEL478]|uniref:Uncharacterized protein n=1 Tax=Gonapodya prolifera (strain JEL478) TaxID=1344416 RepID=A0A139AT48_GONPJ|nr:hypothetical protein M427DRAFT_432552 [Gonapodya prolifera JEL478]|eukprot:KXS19889.1 hypothetical protein M427DRAFT_432552 [Gonapodya prolifera JEL478]